MARQYTTGARGLLSKKLSALQAVGGKGRQGANVNIALAGEKFKNPQKFTEFSIDTKNGWA